MDSISQIALGAGVGELVLGKKIGNKAMLFGAIAGTIPDLDVFFGYLSEQSPAEALLVHRSYSHAAVPQLLMALPFTYLTFRLFKKQISFLRWYLLWYLGFVTHAMLDCCTTYGTQFFLPFSRYLVGFNNVAVVDPLYTLPFLLLLIIAMFFKKESGNRAMLVWLSVLLSTGYLGYATVNKFSAAKVFKQNLKDKQISYTQFSTTPAMFTSWLWNMVAVNDSMIYVAEYSVFQKDKNVEMLGYKRNTELLNDIKETKAVQTLLWFSQGNYLVQQSGSDTLDFFNIKWGRGDFTKTSAPEAFRFYVKIYKKEDGSVTFRRVEPSFSRGDFADYFAMIRKRIFEE